jgi:hypothetical protein
MAIDPWPRAEAPGFFFVFARGTRVVHSPLIALKTLALLDAVREELLAHLALVGFFRHRSISRGGESQRRGLTFLNQRTEVCNFAQTRAPS